MSCTEEQLVERVELLNDILERLAAVTSLGQELVNLILADLPYPTPALHLVPDLV